MNSVVDINAARSPLRYALAYADRGWHVFPVWGAEGGRCRCGTECQSPGKHPVSSLVRRGMLDATTDHDTIKQWWTTMPDAGIAVSLAPSGMAAVDVDPRNGGYLTLELLEEQHGKIDTDLVQFTQGGGEHRFFYLEAGSSLQLPGKLGDGVDLKRNGYSVLPPTTGPAGVYDWEASSNPLDGALPAPLPDWIRSLAKPVDRPAFKATAAAQFITQAQVKHLREALTFIPSDDRDCWVRYGMALRQLGQAGWDLWDEWSAKSDKYDAVDQIRVWKSFKPRGECNYPTIFTDAAKAGWRNPMSGSDEPKKVSDIDLALVNGTAKVTERETRTATPFPVDGLEKLARWLCDRTGAEYGVGPQMAALSVAALAASRRYRTPQGDGLNLHQVVSAQSAAEFTPLMNAVEGLLRGGGFRRMVSQQRLTSSHAMIARLYRTPAMVYLPDDFGKRFFGPRYASIEELNGDIGRNFQRDAIAIEAPHEYGLRKSELNDGDQAIIHRPAFNLLAFTTEFDLQNLFADSYMGRGLVETLLFSRVSVDYPSEARDGLDPPASAVAQFRALRGLAGDADAGELSEETLFGEISDLVPSLREVDFSAAPASARYSGLSALSDNPLHRPILQGSRAILRRLAAVLACWQQPDHPVVTPAMLDWSFEFVRWSTSEIIQASQTGGDGDGKSGAYDKVLAFIVRAGAGGVQHRDLVSRCRPYRNLVDPEKRSALLTRLIEDEEIMIHPRRRGKTYVATSAIELEAESAQ